MSAVATLARARVNPSSLAMCKGTALPAERDHEKMVAAFLAQSEATDPARFAEVCENYPTLSESALNDIRKREVSAFSPSHEANGGSGFDESGIVFATGRDAGADDRESINATVEAAMKRPPLLP